MLSIWRSSRARCSVTSGSNGAGRSTTIALPGLIRPSGGGVSIFGLDVWRDAAVLHRRLSYVPSVADRWPSLTGAETLLFLGTIHGSVDTAYRQELIERFDFSPDTKIPRSPCRRTRHRPDHRRRDDHGHR
jgi:ABC-2 type transport system ATP-binding protein